MRTPLEPLQLRLAAAADIPAIGVLINASVRKLQAEDYSTAQIEGALHTVFGVDSQLISDGTYFVVEAVERDGASIIVGCGGWSKRKTLFGGDQLPGREDSLLDPASDMAKIRAFFVHPDWARRGIGSRLLDACESAATEAGFGGFEMAATLTGERLYLARGYAVVERLNASLRNGEQLPIIRMAKLRSLGAIGAATVRER